MRIGRRRMLLGGGSLATLLALRPVARAAGSVRQITMIGDSKGSHVWFDPVGLLVTPGETVRWVNTDNGNSHTATAYHPDNFERVRRMPESASPWDSDFLLPGETFEWEFSVPGVYDYYCIPHEHAGMVGRIVVDGPGAATWTDYEAENDLPEVALSRFPGVADILYSGEVRQTPGDAGADE
jgi:plastocyanin